MSRKDGKVIMQNRRALPRLRDSVIAATVHLRQRKSLSILLAYSLVAAVFTYPVVLNVATNPAGSPYFVWAMWWAKRSLVDLHANLANLTSLYYPQGAYHPFLWTDAYVMVSPLPLVLLLGPLIAYNVHFLATYALTGFATYLLCYYLTQRHWPSFIGGTVFALSSFRSHQAVHGHLNLMIAYWLPLYVLFLLRLFRKPNNRNALFCGIFLALSVLSNPLHAAHFLIPLTLVFVVFHVFAKPRQLGDLALIKGLGLAILISAIFISPFYFPLLKAMVWEEVGYLARHGFLSQAADLVAFFVPPPSHALVQTIRPLARLVEELTPESGYYPVYIGIVAPLLAAIGAWKTGKRLAFWMVAALLGAVLSLGPLLHVGGQLVQHSVADKTGFVVLPGALLTVLPFYGWIRSPGRFGELTMFCIAVLACYGVSMLFRATGRRIVQWGVAVGLTVLIPLEYALYFPFSISEKPVPEFYRTLSTDVEDYGILDLGPQWNHWGMYYQLTHRHPIVRGHCYRFPFEAKLYLHFMDQLVQPEPDVINRDNVVQVLNQLNIAYIVLQKSYPGTMERFTAFLSQVIGRPAYEDEQIAAFAVPVSDATEVGEIPFLALGVQWHPVEFMDGLPSRWMVNDATMYVRVEKGGQYQLALVVHPYREPRHLQIFVDEGLVDEYHVGGLQSYVTAPFGLNAEEWTPITFHVPEGCEVPSHVMAGEGDDRCLSMLFQHLDVLPIQSGT
jgi:hypothetical protein